MHFSEFAQKYNVNWKQVNPNSHAIHRAKERFGWENLKDDQIKGNLRSLLSKSTYLGKVINDAGYNSAHLFATERRALYVSEDFKKIVTVIMRPEVTYKPLKSKLLELHKKEIRKLTIKENARIKRLEDLKCDCDVDVAMLKRRIKRTKSQSVKLACEAQIKAIHQTIEEYEKEIKDIQDEKRHVTLSMVAMV